MKNVLKALDAAQKEFPVIAKNKTAKMPSYSYKYADLEDVVKGITPTLRKYGLMFTQVGNVIGDRQALKTSIFHLESGEAVNSEFILPNCSDPQDTGIAITYFRRYALCAALGIVTEEDMDGAVKPKDKDVAKQPTMPQEEDFPDFPPPGSKQTGSGLGAAICPFGKNKGLTFDQVGRPGLANDRTYWLTKLNGEAPKGKLKQFLEEVNQYLG